MSEQSTANHPHLIHAFFVDHADIPNEQHLSLVQFLQAQGGLKKAIFGKLLIGILFTCVYVKIILKHIVHGHCFFRLSVANVNAFNYAKAIHSNSESH